MNISNTLQPHKSFGLYPAGESTGIVAAGAGDATEVTFDWVSVTGLNTSSLTAHGVAGEELYALSLEIMCRMTLADTEDFSLTALKVETCPPDSSGDPDAGSLVLVPAVTRDVTLVKLGATPDTVLSVGVTAAVQDDIVVHTSDGGDTDLKVLVRLSFPVRQPSPDGLNFYRVKVTPDLSASGTDTADILGMYGFIPSHIPAYDPKGI